MTNGNDSVGLPLTVSTTAGAKPGATFHCAMTIVRGSRAYPEAGRLTKGQRTSGAIIMIRTDHAAVAGIVPRYLVMFAGRRRTVNVGHEYNVHHGDPTRSVRVRIDSMERLG